MEYAFWLAVALMVYVYAGYPLLHLLSTGFAKPTLKDDDFRPTVSLIIAAHDEEKVIQEKLDNSLALDYPEGKLEIFVASDGSSDRTNAFVKAFADKGIRLFEISPQGGKAHALSLSVPRTHGSIIVFSDANTMYRTDAIIKLVRHFCDPTVGGVSGDVRLVDAAETHSVSEGVYYRYERWLQSLESLTGSIIGADGGMYAVRRELFSPIPQGLILDDFVISMTVARLGYRVLYDPEAIATEQGTMTSWEEFHRKIRIVAGGMQALRWGSGLPRWRQPLLVISYLSHKLLRWCVPFFLLTILVSSALLINKPLYRLAIAGQITFCLIALVFGMNVRVAQRIRWAGIPFYFCLVNAAAFIGILKGLFRKQPMMWKRTNR